MPDLFRPLRNLLVGLLLGALLSGCGTIRSKEDGQLGHVYSGVTRTAEDLECYVVVGSFMLFIPTIIYLFDFPLSLLADTLILPVDLLTEAQQPRAGATWVGHC